MAIEWQVFGTVVPQDMSKNRFFLLVAAYTILASCVAAMGYSYLGTLDDPYLMDFLSHGENRTLIMSYPLSSVVAWLYGRFPDIPWLSWVYFLYLEASAVLYSAYVARVDERALRWAMGIFGAVVLVYGLLNINITFLTLLLVVLAMPLVTKRQVAFWALVLAASLLRESIIVSLLPLLAVGYLLFFDPRHFTKRRAVAVLTLAALLALNVLSPKLDRGYGDWLDFYHARVYFTDLHGADERHVMSPAEATIAKSWFPQDADLLPSEKIIEAAGSELDVILYRLTHLKLRYIVSELYHHKLLLLLILMTAYFFVRYEKRRGHQALYALYAIGFLTLFFIRDVERVTYPLLFLWMAALTKDMLAAGAKRALAVLYAGSTFALVVDLPLYEIDHGPRAWAFRNELFSLAHTHDLQYEPGLGFPMAMSNEMVEAMAQNRLFDEKEWISTIILPAGWISRHPYFYRSHDISAYGKERKFSSYYDFLLDEHSAFIGSKKTNRSMNAKVLKMYDERFGCCHNLREVDASEHFRIVKVERGP